MEKNYAEDETFLGRWLGGELSEEELERFKQTDIYKQLKVINEESQRLEGPDIDVEKALQKVKHKLKEDTDKPKPIRLWQVVSIAAMLIIALGVYMNSPKTYSNGIGETQTITLKDGSTIELNANSSLSLKHFFWSDERSVTLSGEGYFKITKGDDFQVETSKGVVKVLGTEFNIKDRSSFSLQCYEGKVEFIEENTSNTSRILTEGMQINIKEGKTTDTIFEEKNPHWLSGVSKFKDQPFYLVLEELTQYFDVQIDSKNINTNRLYSGSFNHEDLNLAIKATLTPMGISYKTEGKTLILSE